jgi:hypothetical protein
LKSKYMHHTKLSSFDLLVAKASQVEILDSK